MRRQQPAERTCPFQHRAVQRVDVVRVTIKFLAAQKNADGRAIRKLQDGFPGQIEDEDVASFNLDFSPFDLGRGTGGRKQIDEVVVEPAAADGLASRIRSDA